MFANLLSETTGISPSQIILIVLLAVMVIVLIVLPMFTNKKRAKAVNELHSSIAPGDIIKTVGGIIGKVIAVRETSPVDKEMVIETGEEGNVTTMVFDIQAVYQVIKKANAPASEPFENNDVPSDANAESVANEPNTVSDPFVEENVTDKPVVEPVDEPTVEPVVETEKAKETTTTTAPKKTVKKTTAKK